MTVRTATLVLVLLTACASDRRELEQLVGAPLAHDTQVTSWQPNPDLKPSAYYGVRKLDEAGFRRLAGAVGLTPTPSAGIAEAVWRLPVGVTLKGWAAPSVPAGAGLGGGSADAALDLVKKTNNTLAVAGDAFSRQESGVAVRKGNEDLVKAIDAAIADMQKDGSLKALSEKWFGADVTK